MVIAPPFISAADLRMQSAPKFIFHFLWSWTDMRLHSSLQYKISRVIFHKYAKIFWEIDLLACKFVAGYFFNFNPLLHKNTYVKCCGFGLIRGCIPHYNIKSAASKSPLDPRRICDCINGGECSPFFGCLFARTIGCNIM